MILGIISLILFIGGIFMINLDRIYYSILYPTFGIIFTVVGIFGIITFIYANANTIINLFEI